jgi:nucleolar GTP-binding protein
LSIFNQSIRKIKFTQQNISERLQQILSDFPRLNDIHPFYADLCNTLYDRDHYKLALGQINTARSLIDSIARDMIRMVKYGDSLYRCKCLKRAALGRMCTVLKRQKASLAYLEEVRKHLSRLPSLDPNTRTLLMCGLPNVYVILFLFTVFKLLAWDYSSVSLKKSLIFIVFEFPCTKFDYYSGKSSFMNKITRGNVDVQPYAFTTKSLFVGHCDYKYLRWQVIDTPGILDHPLEERNTIEMQSIIALAHLTCSVLYFVDISEQCGYSIEEQCSLFRSIKPLFANKQLIIVVNKVDQQPWETLESDKRDMVQSLTNDANCTLMTMSNISEHGVSEVKMAACDKLLAARVDNRVAGNKLQNVMNRIQVFHPTPRDAMTRDVCIPESVSRAQEDGASKPKRSRLGYAPTVSDDEIDDDDDDDAMETARAEIRKTARDRMWENGGPGVWAPDYRDVYDLKDDSWKYDAIPEFINGKNIADFVDPDILKKLEDLENEEEQIVSELEAAKMGEESESDLEEEEQAAVEAIRDRKRVLKMMRLANKSVNKPVVRHAIRGQSKDKHDKGKLSTTEIKKTMDRLGVDASKMIERGRTKMIQERGRKRERSLGRNIEDDTKMDSDTEMEDTSGVEKSKIKKSKKDTDRRSLSVARSHSRPREPSAMGLKDQATVAKAEKLMKAGRKTWVGAAGEGDHTKAVHLVKWCNTGKKRNGTHYCR